MIEFLLPFSLGYFFSRLISFFVSAGSETAHFDGMILKWDKDLMAWRPCSKIDDLSSKYLLARSVDERAIRAFKDG